MKSFTPARAPDLGASPSEHAFASPPLALPRRRWNTRAAMHDRDDISHSAPELARFIAQHPDTAWLDALVVDLAGTVRGKRYPREDMAKLYRGGMLFPMSSYYLDATGSCLDPLGRGLSDGDPDAVCWPLPGTLRAVPWGARPGAQVLMGMHGPDGAPSPVEPRHLAARELRRLAQMGYHPCCAFELEFYLLDADVPGQALRPAGGARLGQVYRMHEVEQAEALLDAIHAACQVQAIPASVMTSEYAAGQFEINLRHDPDPLRAADQCVLFRRLVCAVSHRHGLRASFMAKPFAAQTGNGMHLHLSLLDDQGRNCFDDGSAHGAASLRHAIGGLLHTLPEAMALYAPNINSFRRFKPATFVPVNASWGYNNRSVAARVPAGDSAARRLEFRVPGADANPYLVLAAVLASVRLGLERRLDPGPPISTNACLQPDAALPLDWLPALSRLQDSALFAAVLGADYLALYCEAKRLEARKFADHISTREYEWYL